MGSTVEYIYQSGGLTCGMGDPWANIHIDEQSFVHTATHAREWCLWPKVSDQPSGDPGATGAGKGGTTGSPTPGISGSGNIGAGTGILTPGATGGAGKGSVIVTPSKTPPISNALTEEGVLKEALTKLWERARVRKFSHIRAIELRLFDATDAFRLLGLVSAIQGAAKQAFLTGGYETTEGGTLQIDFTGPPSDAQPIKEFLEPQLRAAKDKDLTARFDVQFDGAGLTLAGDATEMFTQHLTRFGTGAAYVAITAAGAA